MRIGCTIVLQARLPGPGTGGATTIVNLLSRRRSRRILWSMFTVGGFARLAGVSARVLRAYDASGLLVPAWVDPSSGYRYYSPAQLPGLRRIQALRDVGLTRAN